MVKPNPLWLSLILCVVCIETYESFVTFYLFLLDPFVKDGEVGTYYVEISNMESSPTLAIPMNQRDLGKQACESVCLGACYRLRTLESLLSIESYKICNGLFLFEFVFKSTMHNLSSQHFVNILCVHKGRTGNQLEVNHLITAKRIWIYIRYLRKQIDHF